MARTHLGQRIQDHITLEVVGGMQGGCGTAQLDFIRNLPDGSTEPGPGGLGWRIPQGRFLVVTDLDWQYVHPDGAAGADQIQVLRLLIVNDSTGDEQRVFESTIVLSDKGEGGASESMTAGFVVSSAAHICPDLTPGPTGPPSGLQHLILRGYLVSSSLLDTLTLGMLR